MSKMSECELKLYMKEYRIKNKDKINKYMSLYREKNKKTLKPKELKYQKEHFLKKKDLESRELAGNVKISNIKFCYIAFSKIGIKIGISNFLSRRMKWLKNETKEEHQIAYIIQGNKKEIIKLEKEIKKNYKENNIITDYKFGGCTEYYNFNATELKKIVNKYKFEKTNYFRKNSWHTMFFELLY